MTDKQKTFCLEYLIDLDATKAALRAGYSKKTAAQIGYQLLQKTSVQKRIQQLQKARAKRTEITADRVLKEMALIAFASLDHYDVDEDGNILLTEAATDGAIRALSAVKRKIRIYRRGDTDVKEVDVEIKLWSKDRELENLGKHLGMFGPDGSPQDPHHVRIIMEHITGRIGDEEGEG